MLVWPILRAKQMTSVVRRQLVGSARSVSEKLYNGFNETHRVANIRTLDQSLTN